MRCGAFHRVEGTLCLVRHGQAALSGSKTKAPGFAGGYLLQLSIGNVTTEGAGVIGEFAPNEPLHLNLEFGADGPISTTPTLKRDGVTLGPSLEQYIFDAVHQSVQSLKMFTINGGEECTRYLIRPVNIQPTTPFVLPLRRKIVMIPNIRCDVAVKIAQSRITVDRAQQYRFALAVENCVNGVVSSAARARDEPYTTLSELAAEKPNLSEAPLVNGSIMRVVMKSLFPFEETASLQPGPKYEHL
jgi:hypothetical protein